MSDNTALYPFISNDLLIAIGACVYVAMAIASPILFGREQARGGEPNEAIWFWGAAFCMAIVVLWPLAILSVIVVAIARPIVVSLCSVGAWLGRKEGEP